MTPWAVSVQLNPNFWGVEFGICLVANLRAACSVFRAKDLINFLNFPAGGG